MNDELGYITSSDFEEPADASAGVKTQDENDFSTLEYVLNFLQKEVDSYKTIDKLEVRDHKRNFSVAQQLAVNKIVSERLDIARKGVEDTINGIKDKYKQ